MTQQAEPTSLNTDTPQRKSRKRHWWHEHFLAWQQSGLSKQEYCNQHDISPPSFYKWCSTFRSDEAAQLNAKTPANTLGFVRASIAPNAQHLVRALSIGDIKLEFEEGLTESSLTHWIKLVKHAC